MDEIKRLAQDVDSKDSIAQVASVSAADDAIGALIAEAMEKVGKDGVITVEESKTMGTTLEVVEGMQFDRGYLSAYMCTDMDKMEAVLDDQMCIRDRPYGEWIDRYMVKLKDLKIPNQRVPEYTKEERQRMQRADVYKRQGYKAHG